MHIALITPTSLLKHLCLTSKVQMCLAHQVLADEVYAEFYCSAKTAGQFVLMDNSLWELKEALSPEILYRASSMVNPDELIIPDVFRDGPATIESFGRFMEVSSSWNHRPWKRNMVVVHGEDREEWLECFDYFSNEPEAHTLALPKVLDEMWKPGGRLGAVEFIERTGRVNPTKQYHCLGIWEDPIEVLLLAAHSWVRSLDTALPIHAGMQGVRFHPELGLSRRRPKRPHQYFNAPFEQLAPHLADIQYNVLTILGWANGSR